MNYKIWNKEDMLVTPTGKVFTKEQVIQEYPMAALEGFKFIICDAPINMGVFMEFTQTKEQYKQAGADITDEMTDQEVLDAITEFEQRPQEVEISAEDRIAASLEFQTMMMLPTEGE